MSRRSRRAYADAGDREAYLARSKRRLSKLTQKRIGTGPTLHCPRCGVTARTILTVAGPHDKASCSNCGRYIKFVTKAAAGTTDAERLYREREEQRRKDERRWKAKTEGPSAPRRVL